MSGRAQERNNVGHSAGQIIATADPELLKELPAPPEEFRAKELSYSVRRLVERLANTTAIDATRRHYRGTSYHTYVLSSSTYEKIQDKLENYDSYLPCGHSGLRNCGDHYQCCHDGCDRQFGREEVDLS